MFVRGLPIFLLALAVLFLAGVSVVFGDENSRVDNADLNRIYSAYLEARGGLANLVQVKSMRMTGRVEKAGITIQFVLLKKRPDLVRVTLEANDMKIVEGYDGKRAWRRRELRRKDLSGLLDENASRHLKLMGEFDSALIGFREKGHRVDSISIESVDRGEAHRVAMSLANGERRLFILDAESFLPTRIEFPDYERNGLGVLVTVLKDYRIVGGIAIAHEVESWYGDQLDSRTTIETMELNVGLLTSLFIAPAEGDGRKL